MNDYDDGELFSMARRGNAAARAELWDRAEYDIEYGRGDHLARELEARGIARPGAALASAESVAARYRSRWER
ncbi:hypothetical protein PBI_LUCKY2013_228 [Mycobacterium phage Lucky2013]|uniref:hypothetical protein n=1 Tax=Mycobacterium phage Wanda TaxID=1340713 RepID=UPI0004BE33EB|nr:hypothetical protein N857_gp192 [Mycobacterium phage Wanda]YP_009213456.1 hypothetical protein AVV70_gp198 [Mycobacterium phage MiaZeal]ASD50836.1 hypothetical protein PORCELAIN_232 [Mycobacterium phage Porcelain]ASD53619.1 hypothetical protein PBI_LUCKY2013_228 [Mycobacterium phage Lucky2013]ASZ74304.1 hypothetical protein SEA_SQUINT_229 [Mycobacterium phage Squint]ATN89944.1 hypothetical protein SEA_KLEIN_238 [Mycobacterium phage Klein]AIE57734.1 hypothetical protein PBI_WANDA_230 [Mycob